MVEKPSVIANYMKNMGGVDTADHYCTTYCFLRRTLKWWRKLFFWGLEVSVINAYVLYVESCKNSNSNPMSHIKFRRELVMALVGDFREGVGASTRGRTSTSDNQQRLLHVIIPHPEKKHKDCIVWYICETCDHKPCGNMFQTIPHTEKIQTLECMSDTLDIIHIHIFNLNSKVSL